MPKIVPDIQNKILAIAEIHFVEKGFNKTDMREIAAEAEVAVGTIYLHYQNKETLYMHVISRSWKRTLEKIEEIAQNDVTPEQQLKQVLDELVQEMIKRKSMNNLWMEVGAIHHHQLVKHPENNHFSWLRDPISKIISGILKNITKKKSAQFGEQIYDRLGSFTFIMAVDACMQDQTQTSEKVDLILEVITSYLS